MNLYAAVVEALLDGNTPRVVAQELGQSVQKVVAVAKRARRWEDLPPPEWTRDARAARHRRVLTLTREGRSAREIAEALGLSERQVVRIRAALRERRQ